MISSPQKLRHLDRDLAMGWLIRQDAPQAKEIRDYIDRLRVLVRERDSLEEQLEALRETLDWFAYNPTIQAKHQQVARDALAAASNPASGPSYDFAGSAPDGHVTSTQSEALGEGNDPASGADE